MDHHPLPAEPKNHADKPVSIAGAVGSLNYCVHLIIDDFAMDLAGRALLATGSFPIRGIVSTEVLHLSRHSDALCAGFGILGMLTESRKAEILHAAKLVHSNRSIQFSGGQFWNLHVNYVDQATQRLDFCLKLLRFRPNVVTGNAQEVKALLARTQLDETEFCTAYRTVLVVIDERISVHSKTNRQRIPNHGYEWTQKVYGLNFALGALISASHGLFPDSYTAALEVSREFTLLVRDAGRRAAGPGTFVHHLIDCLSSECCPELAQ